MAQAENTTLGCPLTCRLTRWHALFGGRSGLRTGSTSHRTSLLGRVHPWTRPQIFGNDHEFLAQAKHFSAQVRIMFRSCNDHLAAHSVRPFRVNSAGTERAPTRRHGSILLVTARYFGPIITGIRGCDRPPYPNLPGTGRRSETGRVPGPRVGRSVPLWSVPAIARSRQTAVESYRSASVSTAETSTPATLRRRRPVVTPSARTKNAGQQLCGAEVFGQLTQMWLEAAAAVMAAGIVIPG